MLQLTFTLNNFVKLTFYHPPWAWPNVCIVAQQLTYGSHIFCFAKNYLKIFLFIFWCRGMVKSKIPGTLLQI